MCMNFTMRSTCAPLIKPPNDPAVLYEAKTCGIANRRNMSTSDLLEVITLLASNNIMVCS